MENLTLHEFTNLVASNEPAPGGGSVSALSGTQAAALLAMYCRLSLGKKGLEEVQDTMASVADQADELTRSLLAAITEDTEAFNCVVAAFKLPKGTEEEKETRKVAIQIAFETAARVPLAVAARCLQVMELIRTVVGQGNNTAISDIGVANLQAWAGLQGAAYNVEINLTSLKDQALVKELGESIENIKTRGAELSNMNASVAEEVLKGA